MFYALVIDSNGMGMSVQAYNTQPTSYPSNQVPCTEEQALNPSLYQVVNGAIVSNLAAFKQQQINLLKSSQTQSITDCVLNLSSGNYTTFINTDTAILDIFSILSAQQEPQNSTSLYYIELIDGTFASLTPSDVLQGIPQVYSYLYNKNVKIIELINQVNNSTSTADVQSIIWT